MTNIEQQARELLAAEYERSGMYGAADDARSADPSPHCKVTIAAIVRALTPTGENAKHVEVLTGIEASLFPGEAKEAMQAAIRALSAPDNEEVVGLDLSKVQRWDCETESDGIFNHAVMVPAYDGGYVCYADLQAAIATDNAECPHGVDDGACKECATDNAEAVEDDDTPSRPTELQIEYARGYSDGVKFGEQCANPTPAAMVSAPDNAEAVPSNWCDPLLTGPNKALLGEPGTWDCADIERLLNGIRERLAASPTPAARVSVSDEDLTTVEAAARYFERTGKAVSYVAAIRRLILAHEGRK